MSLQEAYKLKIEAEMELAHAKLAGFKAEAKNYTADAYIKYSQHLEELEKMHHVAKDKLTELSNASEDTWEKFKDGAEKAWGLFSAAVKETTEKFKNTNTKGEMK
jgi:hypothetical protein